MSWNICSLHVVTTIFILLGTPWWLWLIIALVIVVALVVFAGITYMVIKHQKKKDKYVVEGAKPYRRDLSQENTAFASNTMSHPNPWVKEAVRLASSCASNGIQIVEEPTFWKIRRRYPAFDLKATSETSSATCQFQLLRRVQGLCC